MAQGYITDIKHDANGRFGPSWQLYIDGKSLGFLKFAPNGFQVGDFVEYQTKDNGKGYQNLVPGSMNKVSAPAGSAAPAPKAASVITMDRQDVISRQAALNSSLAFVSLLEKAGALPEGKTLTASKKVDKMEAIVVEYMQKFHQWSTGAPYEMPEAAVEGAVQNWDEQE